MIYVKKTEVFLNHWLDVSVNLHSFFTTSSSVPAVLAYIPFHVYSEYIELHSKLMNHKLIF